jgi:peptide/nickel transport system permease protein
MSDLTPVSTQPVRRSLFNQRAVRNPITVIGFTMCLVIVLSAILGPSVAPMDPLEVELSQAFTPPSFDRWFGSDDLGRDLFSRCLYGIGLSLKAAIIVTSVSVVVGLVVGGISGFVGGWVDNLLMRLTDVFLAFPALVLALAIAAALGSSLNNAVLAVAVVWWPWYARMVRVQVLKIKIMPYADAARSIGAGPVRILVRHILPNCVAPVLVMASMDMGNVILTTAGLNFIGLGARPPTPELGAMVGQGRRYLLDYWWVPTTPGSVIVFMALGMNLLGDALRDLLDPFLRGR